MEFFINNFKIIILALTVIAFSLLLIKHYAKIKAFLSEVKVELGKVSWSTRQELIGATGVVVVITLILAVYIGALDSLLSVLLNYFIR
jgi:preprotein translocase subunit SecE